MALGVAPTPIGLHGGADAFERRIVGMARLVGAKWYDLRSGVARRSFGVVEHGPFHRAMAGVEKTEALVAPAQVKAVALHQRRIDLQPRQIDADLRGVVPTLQ